MARATDEGAGVEEVDCDCSGPEPLPPPPPQLPLVGPPPPPSTPGRLEFSEGGVSVGDGSDFTIVAEFEIELEQWFGQKGSVGRTRWADGSKGGRADEGRIGSNWRGMGVADAKVAMVSRRMTKAATRGEWLVVVAQWGAMRKVSVSRARRKRFGT